MTDIEIFLKHIDIPRLAREPNLSEEFIEKYILPNHLQFDKDHKITTYCLREFIEKQTFSEQFIEKYIKHFLPNIRYIFQYQNISLDFIKKYYKNNHLQDLLQNKKITLPINFIIEKMHFHHENGTLFTLLLAKYDMPKEFLLKNMQYINDLIYNHYNQMDYVDRYGDFVLTKYNSQIINQINNKMQIFS